MPGPLVVKNGSKTRSRISSAMPVPVSVTISSTHGTRPAGAGCRGIERMSSFRVSMRSVPPPRHRVARVHRQVQQDLLELAGIGLTCRSFGDVDRLDRDVLADHAVQHLSTCATTALGPRSRAARTCLRLNVSS